ncbi:MAG: Elongation factor Ts [Flavobacteriales bacterium]|nr:MAG: Elongation factor Ts [Flavobacteriales bacterium]
MKITASDVNKLRKSTGAGMMDCKKALEESNGDFDKAIEVLRKKGQKVAANRADRDSSEGVVLAKVNTENTSGVIISLNCETDFVAKNDDYIQLAQKMVDHALKFSDKESFLDSDFDGMKVSEKLLEQTGVIGEKIEIGSFEYISANFVGSYIHAGNKIASIVGLSESFESAKEVGKDLSMQIAAMNPVAIDETGVSQNVVEKEIEIAKDQLRQEGKPEEMLENIAKGKLKKFFKENTLINQQFIKDSNVSILQYLKSHSESVKVTSFFRVGLV